MSAVLSVDGLFRYELRRSCGLGEGKVTWVMFNPSTADAEVNDPTIRRCIDFSQRWGFAEMIVVNLLPIRSPDPKEAWAWHRSYTDFGYPAPEFFTNAEYIDRAADESEKVIAAWGSLAGDLGWSTRDNHAIAFWCLGINSDGQPKHPLYVAKAQPLIPLEVSR
jgi:hypothetical protein